MKSIKAVSTIVKVFFNVFAFLVDCKGFSSLLGFVSLSFLSLTLVGREAVSCVFLILRTLNLNLRVLPAVSLVMLVSISHIGGERVALKYVIDFGAPTAVGAISLIGEISLKVW